MEEATELMERLLASPPCREITDEHGHSAMASARIPMSEMRRITKLKEDGDHGYELASDVTRDLIAVGLPILEMRVSLARAKAES